MIGDNYDWASAWDSILVRRVNREFNLHFGEKVFQTETLWRTLYFPVKISHFFDRRKFSG
jgi:hypothetical protein